MSNFNNGNKGHAMQPINLTSHAVDRMKEECGAKGSVRAKDVLDVCKKSRLVSVEGNQYLYFLGAGVFTAVEEEGVLILVTFIGKKRLGESGRARRAFDIAEKLEQKTPKKKAA